MKRLYVTFLMCLAAAITALPVCAAPEATETRDGVFIHLTHGPDDPHRTLMALNMANLMAEDHDVLVYMDIRGVEVALKDAPDISFSHFKPAKAQLASLKEKGVTVMACPGCLKSAGKSADDLTSSVKVADKKAFFSFTKGRILTLDY